MIPPPIPRMVEIVPIPVEIRLRIVEEGRFSCLLSFPFGRKYRTPSKISKTPNIYCKNLLGRNFAITDPKIAPRATTTADTELAAGPLRCQNHRPDRSFEHLPCQNSERQRAPGEQFRLFQGHIQLPLRHRPA